MIVLDSAYPAEPTLRQRKRALLEEQALRIESLRQRCRVGEAAIRAEIAEKVAGLKGAKS